MKAKSTKAEEAKAKRIADTILKGYQELCDKRRAQREELLKSSHELTQKLERLIKVPKPGLVAPQSCLRDLSHPASLPASRASAARPVMSDPWPAVTVTRTNTRAGTAPITGR